MAFDIGAVVARIDADITGFQKGVGQAKKEAGGLTSSLSDISGSLMGIAKVGLAAGAAVATVTGGLLLKGVKTAGELEAAEQGFVALLGSAKEAGAVMARIKKEAAATPFELTGLVAGTQALTAITKDGDKAVNILLDVGKAIATSGKGQAEMDRVILNLQQVAATGKLTAMDIRQFQGAIPMFNDIIEASGMTAESLQSSENAADLLFEAFEKAGKEGGLTAQGFTAQAGTFNQLISNLSDSITITLSDFVKATGIFDAFKGAVAAVTGVISTLGRKFSMIIGLIRSGLQGDLKGDFLRQFGLNEDDAIVAKWFRFGKVLGNVIENIKGIFKGQDLKMELQEALSFFMGGDMDKAGILATIISGIVTAFSALSKWISENQEMVISFLKIMAVALGSLMVVVVVGAAISALVGVISSPITILIGIIALLAAAWTSNFLGIQDITKSVLEFIKQLWEKYGADIMYIVNTHVQAIKLIIITVLDIIKGLWDRHGASIIAIIKGTWEGVKGYINLAMAIIVGVIKTITAIMNGDWKTAHEALKNMAKNSWDAIVQIFRGAWSIISTLFGGVYAALTKPFIDAYNKISEIANKIKSKLKDISPFTKHSPSLVEQVTKGVGIIKDEYTSIFKDIGRLPSMMQAPSMDFAMQGSTAAASPVNVSISLDGAFVGDEASAVRFAELMGDNIIRRLKTNVRF